MKPKPTTLTIGHHIAAPHLTPRELEAVKLVAAGLCNKEAADKMGVGVKAVEKLRFLAQQKIGVFHPVALVHWAIRNGVVPVGDFGRPLQTAPAQN